MTCDFISHCGGNLFKIIFRASAERLQALPINLRYICKRVFHLQALDNIQWIYCYISRNTDSQKLSIDMITVWRLVEDKLLNMFLRSELNECRSKEESKGELKVMVEIGSCRHFWCTEPFSFPFLLCYSTMDVLQMQMQHCNKYQNIQDLSLPSESDILPIYWSCRVNAIYDLPINLRYIHERVPPLIDLHCLCEHWWDYNLAVGWLVGSHETLLVKTLGEGSSRLSLLPWEQAFGRRVSC